MSWFRLDDQGAFHAKVVGAGNEAYGAWCRAGQWCSQHLTDGIIPVSVARTIAPMRVWERLCHTNLLEKVSAETLAIHDFLDWNPTAESVKAERARKAKNTSDHRSRNRGCNRLHDRLVTGAVTGKSPVRNHGPDPDPDPDPEEKRDPCGSFGLGGAGGAQGSLALTGEPPNGPKQAKAKACARRTQVPHDFAPNAGHDSLAKELGLDLADETPKFIEHHSGKGTLMADWNMAFRTWLRNAPGFARSKPADRANLMRQMDDHIAELEEEERQAACSNQK